MSNVAARLIGMDAGEDYDSHTPSIMHHNPTKDYMLEYEECRKTYLVRWKKWKPETKKDLRDA